MRILFHCWEYPPRGSGIGRYIFHMSNALRQAGHQTVVVTSHDEHGPIEEQLERGVVCRSYDLREIGTPRVAELVLQKAREHHVDWIEGADHLGESASLLSRRPRPPIVIKAHYNDVLKRARYAQAYYGWQKPLITLACRRDHHRLRRERDSVERADILIAPSQRILAEMESQGLMLPSRRGVIPNPIPQLPAWVNRTAPDPTLLLVGRLDVGKGIEYLPMLLDTLTPRFPSLRLEMAGADSYARWLGSTQRWLQWRLGDRIQHVSFLGSLTSAALDDAYRRAWVVIVPSRWDTFPTVVLESMVRSKPLVVSPHGGMPEMLDGTEAAIADPATPAFAEAVASFIHDADRRRQAGASAFQRAARVYDPSVVATDYVRQVQTWL